MIVDNHKREEELKMQVNATYHIILMYCDVTERFRRTDR
jgi:hypothetical protein